MECVDGNQIDPTKYDIDKWTDTQARLVEVVEVCLQIVKGM